MNLLLLLQILYCSSWSYEMAIFWYNNLKMSKCFISRKKLIYIEFFFQKNYIFRFITLNFHIVWIQWRIEFEGWYIWKKKWTTLLFEVSQNTHSDFISIVWLIYCSYIDTKITKLFFFSLYIPTHMGIREQSTLKWLLSILIFSVTAHIRVIVQN